MGNNRDAEAAVAVAAAIAFAKTEQLTQEQKLNPPLGPIRAADVNMLNSMEQGTGKRKANKPKKDNNGRTDQSRSTSADRNKRLQETQVVTGEDDGAAVGDNTGKAELKPESARNRVRDSRTKGWSGVRKKGKIH